MHAKMHKTVLMHVRDNQYKLKSTIFKFYFINVSLDRDVVRLSNIDFYDKTRQTIKSDVIYQITVYFDFYCLN